MKYLSITVTIERKLLFLATGVIDVQQDINKGHRGEDQQNGTYFKNTFSSS